MKIYLSNYWKQTCIFCVLTVFVLFVATVIFCFWHHSEEDYILIVSSSLMIIIFAYLMSVSLRLFRYVKEENMQLVMYSFRKIKLSSLQLDADIYYEVLSLIEGTYSRQDFVVLSNIPFESFHNKKISGLAETCKLVDFNGNQVIMPYNCQYVRELLEDRGRF